MGFGRYEYLSPIGVDNLIRWILLRTIDFMVWRGVADDEEMETIRGALHKTM
jgi:hypothetical protein